MSYLHTIRKKKENKLHFYRPAVSGVYIAIVLSISQSVATFCEYFTNDFIQFFTCGFFLGWEWMKPNFVLFQKLWGVFSQRVRGGDNLFNDCVYNISFCHYKVIQLSWNENFRNEFLLSYCQCKVIQLGWIRNLKKRSPFSCGGGKSEYNLISRFLNR